MIAVYPTRSARLTFGIAHLCFLLDHWKRAKYMIVTSDID